MLITYHLDNLNPETMTREKILEAINEASKLTNEFVNDSQTYIDLVKIAESLDIPILYRPLEHMWGGAVTIDDDSGIIIKSNLPRNLQRFTLAHEIGHIVLGHKNRFDDEVGVNLRTSKRGDRPVEEVAADMFASELLAPLQVIRQNAMRKGWPKHKLRNQENIYQLSLRLGISFEATCWSLVEHNILQQDIAQRFSERNDIVKECKDSVVFNPVDRDPYSDVWSLSKGDADERIVASENDLFIFKIDEQSSSGYRWELDGSKNVDIIIDRNKNNSEEYGSSSTRVIGFKLMTPGNYEISLHHRRPWNDSDKIDSFKFRIDNHGSESIGLPRDIKQMSLEGVTA